MVNESPKETKAYWFFTPHTLPDDEMLSLMQPNRHEVCLHVANHPYKELKRLEEGTGRKINYYTIHGTERLLGRLIWKRKINQSRAFVPVDFPLKNFWDFPTLQFDILCRQVSVPQAIHLAEEGIAEGKILHIHPDWLFINGRLNKRGSYYEALKKVLQVDEELDYLVADRKLFFKSAHYWDAQEYLHDHTPTPMLLQKLRNRDFDIYTFIERTWCSRPIDYSKDWIKKEDNIALLHVTKYDEWLKMVGKKTRNMIRKAEKNGITVQVTPPSDSIAREVWEIFNETPIRQGRTFPHYGQSLEKTKEMICAIDNSVFIGAFFESKLVGFVQLVKGDQLVVMSQILSLQKYWDKAVNNALIAKAVEVCAANGDQWLMYGRIGNHPSLDIFKESNGFEKHIINRYYVVLSSKGRIAVKLRLYRRLKDSLPESIKKITIPLFNWVSRTRAKFRH